MRVIRRHNIQHFMVQSRLLRHDERGIVLDRLIHKRFHQSFIRGMFCLLVCLQDSQHIQFGEYGHR